MVVLLQSYVGVGLPEGGAAGAVAFGGRTRYFFSYLPV